MSWLPLLGALFVCAGASRPTVPDILPPGHKSVEHVLVLEVGPALAGSRFVAFPTVGFGASVAVVPGEPFAFSGKYGTRLYHLRPGEPWPGDDAVDEAFRRSHARPLPCAQIAFVPVGQPLARIESRFRVEGDDGAALVYADLGLRRFDSHGNLISVASLGVWLTGLALLGAGGLWRLARVRAAQVAQESAA